MGQRLEFHLRMFPDGHFVLQSGAEVVVGRRAPEVGAQRGAVGQEVEPADFVTGDEARLAAEVEPQAVARDD